MRRDVLIVPLLLAGGAGGFATISAHESDAAFLYEQEHSRAVEPLQVARVMKLAREPVPGGHGSRAVDATCTAGALRAARRNPWSCEVRYASGRRVRYKVTVGPDGSAYGIDRRAERIVRGCCVIVGA